MDTTSRRLLLASITLSPDRIHSRALVFTAEMPQQGYIDCALQRRSQCCAVVT